MLTLIQSESNEWMVIAVGGELRVYTREQPGEWSELPLSDRAKEVDAEKGFMLEELYVRQDGQEEDEEEPEGLEPEEQDEDEAEGEDELEEHAEPEEDEDGDDEEPEPPRRGQGSRGRRAGSAGRGR